MKKPALLSRWGKYRRMVTEEVYKSVQGDNPNERMEELLEAALSLEVASLILMHTAKRLGNSDPIAETQDLYNEREGLINSYIDISSSTIANNLEPSVDFPVDFAARINVPPGEA
jgi:hypothetical protein